MNRTSKHLVLLFLLIAMLLVGTLMPASLKADIEGRFWSAIPWSHLAHFVLFCGIASLPVYGIGRTAWWGALLFALFLAVCTELLQSFVPGRHPMVRDVLIDLSGAVLGCALAAARRAWAPAKSQAQA